MAPRPAAQGRSRRRPAPPRATHGTTATATGTLSRFTGSAAADQVQDGSAAGTLAAVTGAAAGAHGASGTGDGALTGLSGAGEAVCGFAGEGDGALSAVLGTASGIGGTVEPPAPPVPGQDGAVLAGRVFPRRRTGGWRGLLTPEERRLLDELDRIAALPPPVVASAAGVIAGPFGAARAARGNAGRGAGVTGGLAGQASARTWDSVSADNELLLLAS
jgi:hypothetical protein